MLICLAFLSHTAFGQIPESLVTERSVVLMDMPLEQSGEYWVRGNWQKSATEVQKNLRLMGVDAVAYLHADDWDASPTGQASYILYFTLRQVKNMIRVGVSQEGLYQLSVMDFATQKVHWETTAGSLAQALLRLGLAIKQAAHTTENFLPADQPEIITDVPISRWTASLIYPDQIKRLKVGVARMDTPEENAELERIMEQYPFGYDLIDFKDDEDAFRQGYQFVLVNIHTTGKSIRQLLNYPSGVGETHYLSTAKADSVRSRLKSIPINANVHKFYFRHTVNHESYVGKEWDADVTWQLALENFIHNIRLAFKVK